MPDKIAYTCDTVAGSGASHKPETAYPFASCCDSVATTPERQNTSFDRRSLLDELKSKGVRITAQRRVLVDVIQEAKEHLDVASLLKLARQREANVDRATVYRTILLLKRLRLVDELDLMHLNGEKHYYEVRTRRDHVHLACFRCGRIQEFTTPVFERLKDQIAREMGFAARVTRLEVGGICSVCSGAAEAEDEGLREKPKATSSG
jgi:Fe2+ or Zn2+ uptake regulation protein